MPVSQSASWLPHTNIVLQPYTAATRAHKLGLNNQNDSIKKLLNRAQADMLVTIVSDEFIQDDEFCPLTVAGFDSIAWSTLIRTAEDLKFGGPLDIADRLQRGDENTYIKPFIAYLVQRVTLDRSALKTSSSPLVLAAFGLEQNVAGFAKAQEIIRDTSYIYPVDNNGQFIYSAETSFAHPVVAKGISTNWFSQKKYGKLVGAQKQHLFASSIKSKPLEFEMTKGMVIMASCIIYAVLLDHKDSKPSNFPPKGIQDKWVTFRELLDKVERTNKLKYHKFMHELYLSASREVGPATHSYTQNEVLKRIDWEAFEKDTDSDLVPAPAGGPVHVDGDGADVVEGETLEGARSTT
ncbi:hypothetical protein K435DRAFT_874620 [Dendrothele bispora CBS 962.96]|uniref:DUF6532 domain-containing protein n=1 Tax=Dendrothele bispora (strain CBS 962.96) TaxID=1314807 RepID=A0A4S8KWL2_DENBC|nr:hypothetical protein K435DRAFT_874620 [Dendrothele bispora CBS 962.96]